MDRAVLVVIPARGGSKRLPGKNVALVLGRPALLRAIDECRKSRYVSRLVVSTEDSTIATLCEDYGVEVIHRPEWLARDDTPKQDVIVHATQYLADREDYQPAIVVSLQPNTPEFQASHLDEAIDFFRTRVFPGHPVKEVFTVGKDLIQNGAFRIMTWKTVFQKTLSTYVGVYVADYIDVHTADDLKRVEERINQRTSR